MELLDAIGAGSDRRALRGTVRVAAYRSVATHVLTPLFYAIAKRHRALRIEIDDSSNDREDVERLVRDGRVDRTSSPWPVVM